LLVICVGIVLMSPLDGLGDTALIGALLVGAGLLWVLAAGVYALVAEFPGETGGSRSAIESLSKLNLLVTDQPFRRFVITRALLLCSALSAPFYVALAQANRVSGAAVLGSFVAAAGLASLLSAPVWGRVADRSSRNVIVAAALLTSGIGLLIFGVHELLPELVRSTWFLPAAYFVLSIAHSGVRVGRKTYVIDLATGNKRTDYVAISNTVIGILLLLVGSLGALAPVIGNHGLIALLSLMGLAGALLGMGLPETQDDQGSGDN
jgi:MFS family permease